MKELRQTPEPTPTSNPLRDLPDAELVKQWKADSSVEHRTEILRRIEPAISAGLRSWGGNNPSLRLRATLVGMQAIDRYDPTKASNASLRTFVSSSMPKLARFRDQRTSVIHIPDSVKTDVRYLTQLTDRHVEAHGVKPSGGRLKDLAGMSKTRFEKARRAFADTSGVSSKVVDREAVGMASGDDKYKAWVDAVYTGLDERSQTIFENSTGYMGAQIRPKKEIAKQLGISASAVSQRLSVIRRQLEEYTEG